MSGPWRSIAGVAVALLGLLIVADVQAQTVQAGDLILDFTGRAQAQLNTTSVGEEELGPGQAPPAASFELRRTRLGANVVYDGWIEGRIEVELTGDAAQLTDAYIDLPLGSAFGVRAGQFKKPFGLYFLESNTRTITIERDARLRGLEDLVGVIGETHWLLDESGLLGRDVGVMLMGQSGGVGLELGLFNGEGPNTRDARDTKAFASRVTVAPVDGLLVGGAVSVLPTDVLVGDDEVYATAFAVDAEWGGFRDPGLRVMAEAMAGENPLVFTGDDPGQMMGVHVAASWFAPRAGRVEGIEPLLRVSWADPETDVEGNEGVLLTPGANVYFSGRNRLMVNGEFYIPSADGVDPQYGLLARLQIYF